MKLGRTNGRRRRQAPHPALSDATALKLTSCLEIPVLHEHVSSLIEAKIDAATLFGVQGPRMS